MRNEIEVMRVLRLPPMGKLVVQVNNNRYETLSEIQEENVKQLLLAAIGELVVFAGGYNNMVEAGIAPPITPTASGKQSEPTLEEQQAKFVASLEAERDSLRATPRPKPQFPVLSGIQPSFDDDLPPKPPKALSLVEQIDAILQKHVEADPSLLERVIRLEQNPKGGLQILVDGTYYQRPKDIEDMQIQLVIKKALKEWEAR